VTTLADLEVYILSYLDHDKKEIGFVGHAVGEGYGVPHPGTVVHPNYRGSLNDPQVYYRVDRSEFIVWSCEAMILTFISGTALLETYRKNGYKFRHINVRELKRRNVLYRPDTWQDD
jgi:hypothetical protein